MGYGELEGPVYALNPETGERSEMGWIVGAEGLAVADDLRDLSVDRLSSSFQSATFEFKMLGREADNLARILFGLPYRHPRQILHNGRKPTHRKRR